MVELDPTTNQLERWIRFPEQGARSSLPLQTIGVRHFIQILYDSLIAICNLTSTNLQDSFCLSVGTRRL